VNTTANVPLYVHFASRTNSDIINKNHYVQLTNLSDSWTFAVRATAVYVSAASAVQVGSFSLAAELTSIPQKELRYPLSGSGINTD
jgi:hypothetical protein